MELVAVLIFIIAILFIQNVLYERYGFSRLSYRCYFSTNRAIEGDEVEIIEEVSNAKWLPLAWFKSEITTSKWLNFAGAQSEITDDKRFVPSFFMLKSYHKVQRNWHVKCLKRGRYNIDSVTLVSTDLFGNVTLSKSGSAFGQLLVLPKPIKESDFTLLPRYINGETVVKRYHPIDPFEFSGVREYSGRESFRDIHWAATAKENRLMVFNKESTSERNLAVLLNLQSRELQYITSVDREFIEVCIKIAAGVLQQGLWEGLPISFYTNSSFDGNRNTIATAESKGIGHYENILELLALLPTDATEKFPSFLQNTAASITATDIVIVTSYPDEAMIAYADKKRAHGSNVKILSLSDCENKPPCLTVLTHLRESMEKIDNGMGA